MTTLDDGFYGIEILPQTPPSSDSTPKYSSISNPKLATFMCISTGCGGSVCWQMKWVVSGGYAERVCCSGFLLQSQMRERQGGREMKKTSTTYSLFSYLLQVCRHLAKQLLFFRCLAGVALSCMILPPGSGKHTVHTKHPEAGVEGLMCCILGLCPLHTVRAGLYWWQSCTYSYL